MIVSMLTRRPEVHKCEAFEGNSILDLLHCAVLRDDPKLIQVVIDAGFPVRF
jgi:hypothetical protein